MEQELETKSLKSGSWFQGNFKRKTYLREAYLRVRVNLSHKSKMSPLCFFALKISCYQEITETRRAAVIDWKLPAKIISLRFPQLFRSCLR